MAYQGLPEQRRLLDAIAAGESSYGGDGYDVLYGGGRFTNFGDHPRQYNTITSGPNAGQKSSAAGRYQFLASTWDDVAREAGLSDFSRDSQDAGAWHLADRTYRQRTGRDLLGDLQSGDTSRVASALSSQWTSIPGGIEPNNATSGFNARLQGGPMSMAFAQQRPGQQRPQDAPALSPTFMLQSPGAFFEGAVPENMDDVGGRLQNAGAFLQSINSPAALGLISSNNRINAARALAKARAGAAKDPTMGAIPPGYQLVDGKLVPIPGGPAADKVAEAQRTREQAAAAADRTNQVVNQDIDRAISTVQASPRLTTGIGGKLLSNIPGTDANSVSNLLNTIKANVSFEKLQEMRAASKTGGALGSVSDFENRLLQGVMGALEQSQTQEDLVRNLQRLKTLRNEIIHHGIKPPDQQPQGGGDQRPSIDQFFS